MVATKKGSKMKNYIFEPFCLISGEILLKKIH